jgi:hypothetical protein
MANGSYRRAGGGTGPVKPSNHYFLKSGKVLTCKAIALNDKRLKDNISTLFLNIEEKGFLLCIFNLNL